MKLSRILARTPALALLVLITLLFSGRTPASGQAKPLITQPVSEANLVQLKGNTPAELKNAKDLGAVDASRPTGRLILVLKRSNDQEADLQSFLQQAHEQSSPNFHKWLAPAAFAQRFGAVDSDLQQVNGWLQSHGLTVAKTSKGKTAIEFSGTVGQVNEAFHTSIHSYNVKGVTHYSNSTDPMIPAALAPVVAGVTQLNDFRPIAQNKLLGQAAFNPKTHKGTPQWTYPEGTGNPDFYFLTPEDFATQYDAKSVYAAGTTGAGQTIGIINESNIDISLVNAYRKIFGLPVNPPQVVIDGTDPGINGAAIEAYLDVENAGAVAPAATVKLYIASSYGIVGGGIDFSMLRAIDDDEASVLSLSFGNCEEDGTAGNQFINSVWEQAAAQGQTVFVSTGDSGSFGCYGLGVNGLASTPWDIAVGGTDAYFSDYATGGASVANYWNSANDANLGSLQKPMPEQPWNGSIYGLNSTVYDPNGLGSGVGGGGGASACAVGTGTTDPATGLPICTSGYPKPSWQVGKGVPNDSVRDLPDISLFASNGYNGVTWPVCAEPGDCTGDNPGTNTLLVTGVGGTSASAPAMAGIMALVNQKYGAQGQANYTLYPLAAQFPSVINAVDIGSNNEPCYSFEVGSVIGCVADPDGSGNYSLQNYSATPGYDLASGLGTVDIASLIANWGSITFKPSTTTLTLTPATITHGQAVTATATVTGTGTPAGSVALVSSATLPTYKGLTTIALGAGGTGTSSINFLPGGTYTVYGQYGGDGINGASKSSATTVTVTPENSVINFSPQYENLNTFQVATLTPGSTIPYDSELVLDATVLGASLPANAATYGQATGSITFSDNGTVIGTVGLSAAGTAELTSYGVAVGKHSITLSYSGDASYNASATTAPFTFTVQPVGTFVDIFPDPSCVGDSSGNYDCITGQTTQNAVLILSAGAGAGPLPTGTITFQYGSSASVTEPITPSDLSFFGFNIPTALAYVTLPTMATGAGSLTVTYNGDANYTSTTSTQAFLVAPSPLAPSNTTLTLASPTDPTTITPSTPVTLTATVTGANGVAPSGTITVFALDADEFTPVNLVPGTNGTSSATLQTLAGYLLPGQNSLTATYSGDKVYQPSTSNLLTSINNSQADFSVLTQSPSLVIASGSTGTATIALSSLNGFNGSVALTCSSPSAFTCSLAPSSVSLNGAGSTVLTLNAFTTSTSTAANHSGSSSFQMVATPLLACMFLLLLPNRRRFGRVLSVLMFGVLLSTGIGCGSKTSPAIVSPVTTTTKTPAGIYTVVVSGTSSTGTIHNTAINVIVQ